MNEFLWGFIICSVAGVVVFFVVTNAIIAIKEEGLIVPRKCKEKKNEG